MNLQDLDNIDGMNFVQEAIFASRPHLEQVINALIEQHWWPKKSIQDWTEDDLTIIDLLLRIEDCTDDDISIFESWIENDMQKAIESGVIIVPREKHDSRWDDLINHLKKVVDHKKNINWQGK